MTSQINPSLINAAFPVAGINQPSQGFRDNFGAIKSGLTTAKSEITAIHNTVISFDSAGDLVGLSDPLGTTNSGQVNFLATLKTFTGVAGSYNGAASDISLTIDDKGRVTAVTATTVSGTGQPTNTVFGPSLVDESSASTNSMGSGSGTLTLPTMRYDNQGRAAQPGTVSYSFGLLDHDMARGSILAGDISNVSAVVPPPPNFTDPYYLTVDSTAPSGLKWTLLDIPEESVVAFSDGPGIDTSISNGVASISIDIDELPSMITSDLDGLDKILVFDASAGLNKTISWNFLRDGLNGTYLTKVEDDTAPTLGGDLQTNGNDITGDQDYTIRTTHVDGVLTLNSQHLVLQGTEDISVVANTALTVSSPTVTVNSTTELELSSPSLLLNNQRWPIAPGSVGQYLSTDGSGQLSWVTSQLSMPRTLFVIETAFGGDDINGTGALDRPFATIAKAVDEVPNNSDDMWTIMIIGGSYPENFAVVNKKHLTIEGFFYGNKPKLTGFITIDSGTMTSNWQNLIIDSTARPIDDLQAGLTIISGCHEANFNNCDFLRGIGAFSELPMVYVGGIQTGPVTFENSIIQGQLVNNLESQNGQRVVINNPKASAGFFCLNTGAKSNTRVAGATHIKGISHDSGILELENISTVETADFNVTITHPSIPQLIQQNNPAAADYMDPVLELDGEGNTIPVLVLDGDGNFVPGQEPVLDNDRNIVYETDSSGNPIQQTDGEGDPVFEEDGITPVYVVKMTSYQQASVSVPSTTETIAAGLYSRATESTVDEPSSLILRNVNMWANGNYSPIYKSGDCEWKFENVTRRSDLDTITGDRIGFQAQPDVAQFMTYYVANGTSLRYADTNETVPDNKVNVELGRVVQVILSGNSTIALKSPAQTLYNPGPLANSGEFVAEVTIAVKQDATGNRTVLFNEDSGNGITWLTAITADPTANAYTFYQFKYLSRLRKWIGQRQSDAVNLKITPTASLAYTLQSSDANSYVRRSNAAANTVIVPNASTVQFAVGTQIHVIQSGPGATSIAPAAGVVINTPETYQLKKRFSKVTLTKVSSNAWDLSGDLAEGTVEQILTVDSTTILASSTTVLASGYES